MKTTPELAHHLLLRTGFGGRPDELRALIGRPWADVVKAQLKGLRAAPATALPTWADEGLPREGARRGARRERGPELRAWWLVECLQTPSPLTERLTLMWHNHLTSSLRKVKLPTLLLRQNLTLRREGTRNVQRLLQATLRDPAMLLYLDNARSHRDHPNENLARELMELFTLGEGHYTEQDVREVARALTGWRVNRTTGAFRFAEGAHDDGEKVILGQRGRWTGDDALRIILEQKAASRHIAARLWREFGGDTPEPKAIEAVAASLRASKWEVAPALETLLLHPSFTASSQRGAMLKSPVELVVGTLRQWSIEPPQPEQLCRLIGKLGQELFDPPNVKGWSGGPAWITSHTLLLRYALLERLVDSRPLRRSLREKGEAARWLGEPPTLERMAQQLNAAAPVTRIDPAQEPAELVAALLLDPTYQLK